MAERGETIGRAAEAPVDTLSAATVIERFGGIRPTAARLAVPVTTVQGWKERGRIPAARWAAVRAAARAAGVELEKGTAAGEPEQGAAEPAPSRMRPLPSTEAEAPVAAPETVTEATSQVPPSSTGRAAEAMRGPSRLSSRLWWLLAPLVVVVLAAGWSVWSPLLDRAPADDTTPLVEPGVPAAEAPFSLQDRIAALETSLATVDTAARLDELTTEGDILAEELVRLVRRVATIESELAKLASAPAGEVASNPGIVAEAAALADGLDMLRERVANLTAENEGLREQIDALVARLNGIYGRIEGVEITLAETPAPAGVAETLVLAAGQLREALARAGPYAAELAALRALAETDRAVAAPLSVLEAHAPTGVATREMLAREFPSVARAVVAAAREAEGGWTGRILARLSDVISVRRTGDDVEGTGAEALVAAAESQLKARDFANAVATVERITGAPAAAAARWLSQARARTAADRALSALDAHAIALLTRAHTAAAGAGE